MNLVVVFFLYGLAFFSMGLVVGLEARRAIDSRFARALRPLAAFGILHGTHEWLEMFSIIAARPGACRRLKSLPKRWAGVKRSPASHNTKDRACYQTRSFVTYR
ncbi:MAG: hypothetical protein HY784_13785 [Chloroflexi bacterium]|nr:hypothetical protein [Chloroflexota bacterium]